MEPTRLLYSRREAATALALGVRTLDQLIHSGKIPAVRVGRRVLISKESLEGFADSEYRVGSTAAAEQGRGDTKRS
jgi:excisionase family DNA binding protein